MGIKSNVRVVRFGFQRFDLAKFALETAVRSLEYFERFFDIPFPLNKTDLLALDDFEEGAMENWGLMTFRDILLLYEKDKSTEKMLEQTALVIAHEFSHQYFGNLGNKCFST